MLKTTGHAVAFVAGIPVLLAADSLSKTKVGRKMKIQTPFR